MTGPDGLTDDGSAPAGPQTLKAQRPKRCTMDTGRPRPAADGYRKDKCVLNEIFSCHAPLVRRNQERRRNEPLFKNVPEQDLHAEFRVGAAAPGRNSSFSGKPRIPDEGLHAHGLYLGHRPAFSMATQCRRAKPSAGIRASRTRRSTIRMRLPRRSFLLSCPSLPPAGTRSSAGLRSHCSLAYDVRRSIRPPPNVDRWRARILPRKTPSLLGLQA